MVQSHPEFPHWPRKEPDADQWQRELRFAERVQAMLSGAGTFAVPGASAAGCSIPHYAVGGDYYDIVPLPDGGMRLMVADVMGKGFGPAMIMTMVRSAVRFATREAASPGTLLKQLNDLFYRDLQQVGSFVTVSCTDYRPVSRTLTVAGAGHPYPLLFRSGGMRRIEARGVSIGMLPDRQYAEQVVPVEPGDRLVVFSDGILEARDSEGREIGVAGLEGLVRTTAGPAGPALLAAILSRVTASAWEVRDDVTLAVVDFTDPTESGSVGRG